MKPNPAAEMMSTRISCLYFSSFCLPQHWLHPFSAEIPDLTSPLYAFLGLSSLSFSHSFSLNRHVPIPNPISLVKVEGCAD